MTTTPPSQDSSTSNTDIAILPGAPAGWQRLRLVLVLGALTALGPFTVDMYLSAFPAIAVDFGTSEATVQFTLTGTLVGFAAGQLIIGPLSDAVGRKRPLIVGSLLHLAASLGCFLAPNIEVLAALRVFQGLGGAAGAVIAMAVVRDLYEGHDAAVMMSRLMLVMGVAPILAPTIGGSVLAVASWHYIFLVLALLGLVAVILGLFVMPETLSAENRQHRGVTAVGANYARLSVDRSFMRLVTVCGLGRVLMFSYIAASPFVLQDQFGLDPQQFGLAFAAGAAVLIAASQLNVVLLRVWSPRVVLRSALCFGTVVGLVFVALAATDTGGFLGFGIPVLLMLWTMGSVMPNAPVLALAGHGAMAGTASALIGGVQFAFAAVASPVVGLLGNDALAVASMMACSAALALVLVSFGERADNTEKG